MSRPARPLSARTVLPGGQQPGLDRDRERVQADLSLAELGVGQAPGDRHPLRRGEQVEREAPVVAGVGGAEPLAARSGDLAAVAVSRDVPQGSGVASITRRSSHQEGLIRARWLIALANSGAAALRRLWYPGWLGR
jgi:hypothetical protein